MPSGRAIFEITIEVNLRQTANRKIRVPLFPRGKGLGGLVGSHFLRQDLKSAIVVVNSRP